MYVRFSFEAASQREVGALGASWISAALEVQDPVACEAVLHGTVPAPHKTLPPDRPLTEPDTYWAHLTNVYEASPGSFKLRGTSRPLTAAGIKRVVANPAASCISVTAQIVKTDGRGYPIVGPGAPGGSAVVDFEGPGNSTGVFSTGFDEHDPEETRQALSLTREYVSGVDLSFGMIRGWATTETAFEKAWGAGAYAQQLGSRDHLYGYGWLTLVPAELARRVREPRLERARSTLHIVDVLPNGALWLQATPDPRNYSQAAMRAVFETVVDVLPDGGPVRIPWDVEWVDEVVYEDAADWR